ncbi:MAG: hypothetical protein R6W90_02955 [Ignavibacteriaceae bacterium]
MLKRQLLFSAILILSFILTSCCSADKTTKENREMPSFKAAESIPPNSADVKVKILNVTESGEDIICRAEVEQVTGYGASTPPLPAGKEIEIHFTKKAADEAAIKINSRLYLRASHLFSRGDEKDYWAFIKFIKE